jgi:hypothetical protein
MAKVKIIKSIRKKLFPLEVKKGPGAKDKFKKLDPKDPYYNVDELGSPPLHRGYGASGTQKKKQKEVGKKIEEGFKIKQKETEIYKWVEQNIIKVVELHNVD